MTISAVSPALASTLTPATSITSPASSISTDGFLQLLVTQLQNQNPLDPTNTNDFMNQIMSYASYSQQQTMNSNLSSLVTSMNSMLSSNGLGYIGSTIEAKGDTTTLQNGSANWGYSLGSDASNVAITVKDQSGNILWSGSGDGSAGKHTFTWDGTTSSGQHLTRGDYTVSVNATNASGGSVLDYTSVIGKVTGVDSSSGSALLVVGDTTVAINSVIGINS